MKAPTAITITTANTPNTIAPFNAPEVCGRIALGGVLNVTV
ncbi:hypothetical protein RV14_GL001155 [Enterococcus ratti]|uniref:Uncharacterized protein n=1 Tax=Enterococcus ratti TaxID=150033 RepID=A0A1L8WBI0_9ENTE|nr:hypothetical protein RV14_GL001155 [Enterococcus ratti]